MIVAKPSNSYQYEAPLRATIRSNRQVRRVRKPVIGPMARIAIAGLTVVLLLLGYVTEKNVVMSNSYQLDELERQLEQAVVERDRLSLQVLGLRSLERIDLVARAELGMIQPQEVRYVAMAPVQNDTRILSGSERVVAQIAEYISGLFTSVAKAAGLYEGR